MGFKSGIFVFLILASFSTSFAAKDKSAFSSELVKESYLPAAGETALLGRFSIGNSKTSLKGPAGTVLDSKGETTDFSYRVGYGFTDWFTLGIQGKYSISDKRDNSYGAGSSINGTSQSLKSSGIEEPEIAAAFRVYENEASHVRVNIYGGVSPKLQTAKYATPTSDGNAGTGANQYRFAVNIYKEVDTFEMSLGLSRTLIDLQKSEDPSNSQLITENSEHQTTEITIGALKQLTETLSIGAGFGLFFSEGYKATGYTNNQVTSNINYDSSSVSAIILTGKYQMTRSSVLILDFTTLLNMSQTATSGTVQLNIGDASSNTFRLGWLQSF